MSTTITIGTYNSYNTLSALAITSIDFIGTNITTSAFNVANTLATNITSTTLNVTNAKATNTTTTALYCGAIVTNSVVASASVSADSLFSTSQSYASLVSRTNQTISHNTVTELTTYWTGTTNIVGGLITNPTSGRLSVSAAGKYLCSALVAWASGSTGERSIFFRINGGTGTNYNAARTAATVVFPTVQSTCILDLAANDYVSVWCYHTQGSSLGMDYTLDVRFSMCRVL